MAVEYLWHGAEPVSLGDVGDYELGTIVEVLAQVTIEKVRVWMPPPTAAPAFPGRKARVWDRGTGLKIGEAILPDTMPSGWSEYALEVPVVVAAGKVLVISFSTIGYGFIETTAPMVSSDGAMYSPTASNLFNTNPGLMPANASGTTGFYGVDVMWELGDTTGAPEDAVITASAKVNGAIATLTYTADQPATFAIDWGDGSTSAGSGPRSHTYAAPGSYAVRVEATTAGGRESSTALVVKVEPFPTGLAYDIPVAASGSDVMMDFIVAQFDAIADANVGTRIPSAGLSGRLPFVRANHWGGESNRFATNPVIDVDIFAATYAAASDLARRLEAKLLGYPFRVSSGGRSVLVDSVQVLTETVEVEWQQDSTIRRFQGTYQFSIRR